MAREVNAGLKCYSIGHGNDKLEAFLARLQRHGVQMVCDVRRFPDRARLPYFQVNALRRALHEHGIEYACLGDRLGGFREGGYASHMRTAAFKEGLRQLSGLTMAGTVAMLCAEFDPGRCHRRMIADALAASGMTVLHILQNGTVVAHNQLNSGQTLDLFER